MILPLTVKLWVEIYKFLSSRMLTSVTVRSIKISAICQSMIYGLGE